MYPFCAFADERSDRCGTLVVRADDVI